MSDDMDLDMATSPAPSRSPSPIAGPSAGPSAAPAASASTSAAVTPAPSSSARSARWRPLPRTTFRSIEYPGPMQRAGQILHVVTQADVDACFNAPMSEARLLEMKYRPMERASIPVRGSRVATQKVMVKVVRKRRKKGRSGEGEDEGVFTANIVGSIPQTVRFRSMADYQYTPRQDGHVAQLVQSLVDLDYDAILDYQVPSLHEEYIAPTPSGPGTDPSFPYMSLLELQPTPIMSQRHLPHVFNYKMNAQTVEEKVWDEEAGVYKSRYVNKSRVSGWAVPVIGHGHPVPTEPDASVREMIPKLEERIVRRLRELMDERPVWQRYALLAQFSDADRYEIESNKVYLPATGFTYGAGPYWKCIVRYGYDPCSTPDAHKYQRVYVYLDVKRTKNSVLNVIDDEEEEDSKRPSFWWENEQQRRIAEGLRPPIDTTKVHIFDGQVIHRNKPDYQLLDITDPFILPFIYDPLSLQDTCEPHSGWYRPLAFELIKALLRVRYAHLRDKGVPVENDEGCNELVDAYNKAVVGDDKDGAEVFIRRLAAGRRAQNTRT